MSAIPQIAPENKQFLRAAVAGGIVPSHTEAIDRAVRLLRERQEAMDRILTKPVPLPKSSIC